VRREGKIMDDNTVIAIYLSVMGAIIIIGILTGALA
jgi:hypothetical protein